MKHIIKHDNKRGSCLVEQKKDAVVSVAIPPNYENSFLLSLLNSSTTLQHKIVFNVEQKGTTTKILLYNPVV